MSNISVKSDNRRSDSDSPSQSHRRRRRISVSCCCRYGYVPLFLAILITIACLLDVYSSISCEFLQVNIQTDVDGSNRGSAFVGIFFRQTGAFDGELFGQSYLAEGCQSYSRVFEETVIHDDKIWQATRYIAMISAVSGGAAAVVCWLFVLTPISITCLWRGLLLPLLINTFLAEGLKFLFLDVDLCSAPLWYTSRTNCQLATTAYICIAACVVFFLCPILVCLFKPQETQSLDQQQQDINQVPTSTSEESQEEGMESQLMKRSSQNESKKLLETARKMDPIGETLTERQVTFATIPPLPRVPIDP